LCVRVFDASKHARIACCCVLCIQISCSVHVLELWPTPGGIYIPIYAAVALPRTLEGPGPVGVGAVQGIRQRWLEAVAVHWVAADGPGLQQWDLCCCDQEPGVGSHGLGDAGVNLQHTCMPCGTHTIRFGYVGGYRTAPQQQNQGATNVAACTRGLACACHAVQYSLSDSGCGTAVS
jgi:hypothetical protein